MSIDQIAPEALKLPTKERALLAASLWESIEDSLSLAEVRDQEIECGKVAAVSHQEMMQRLRK